MKNLDLTPIKVAIADDHHLFRTGVRTSLSGHKDIQMVAEAENGMQLLNLLKHIRPDVILLDIQMPIMDGLEATKIIRSQLKNQPYIVALTANAMVEDREICLLAGMDNYISKPIKIEELIGVLKLVFEKKSSGEQVKV